jgi:excisionase family DNA binding protein
MTTNEKFVTVNATATRLAVDPKTVRRWLASGKLRGVKLGTPRSGPGRIPWRISESAISEFLGLDSQPEKAATGAD